MHLLLTVRLSSFSVSILVLSRYLYEVNTRPGRHSYVVNGSRRVDRPRLLCFCRTTIWNSDDEHNRGPHSPRTSQSHWTVSSTRNGEWRSSVQLLTSCMCVLWMLMTTLQIAAAFHFKYRLDNTVLRCWPTRSQFEAVLISLLLFLCFGYGSAAARFGEGKKFRVHLTDEAKMCLIN